MSKDMDWISSNSKVYASLANADVLLLWCYSYGPTYPYQGGRLHRIYKVADGAIAAADVFDEAWSAQLTGVTPGLDETKDYIIRGVIYDPAAKDELGVAVRIGTQKGPYKMIGVGPGNFLHRTETIFWYDGIPIHGLTGIIAEHLAGTTATPWAGLVLEEIGEGYTVAAPTGSGGQGFTPAQQQQQAGWLQGTGIGTHRGSLWDIMKGMR